MTTRTELIEALGLTPHDEGGFFFETYRSAETVPCADRPGGRRPTLTCIYYLLTADAPRGWLHRNRSDIVHFFHAGGPLRYLTLTPDGALSEAVLGPDPTRGHRPQLVVPAGVWKATELLDGDFALVGEAVAPGFDYRDRELADRHAIGRNYPQHAAEIARFLAD